jgi:hypothetical protein
LLGRWDDRADETPEEGRRIHDGPEESRYQSRRSAARSESFRRRDFCSAAKYTGGRAECPMLTPYYRGSQRPGRYL